MGPAHSHHRKGNISRALWRSWVVTLALLLLVALGLHAAKRNKNQSAMDQSKRALHALDRLTFGPRPGDLQAVTAMGIDKWIDLQLHPERIDNSAMQARLAGYRTLAMSSREMLFEFPPNPVIKAVMDGKLPMPQDPYRHAVYAAAIDRMEQQQEKQKAAKADAATANVSASSASMSNLSRPSRQPTSRSVGKTGVKLPALWMH